MDKQDRIRLSYDGTLDTVLVCRACGAEARYTCGFDDGDDDPTPTALNSEEAYNVFVEWAIEDFDSEHECPLEDYP